MADILSSRFLRGCFYLLLTLTGLLTGILLFTAYGIRDPWAKTVISDLLYPLWNLISFLGIALAAIRSRVHSRQMSTAWGFIGLAQLSYVLGNLVWFVYEIILRQTPYPSLSDALFLTSYPLFVAGIILIPTRPLRPLQRLKIGLDIGIIMACATLGLWVFLLGPLIVSAKGEDLFANLITMTYPLADLLMFWGLILLAYRRIERRYNIPLLILGIGALFLMVTDLLFSDQTLLRAYQSGGLLDLGWGISCSLGALAGLWQSAIVRAPTAGPAAAPIDQGEQLHLNAWTTYIPYLWLIGAYLLLVRSHNQETPISFLNTSIWVGLIICLVLIRQMLALAENRSLFARLQGALDHVRRQADELGLTNRELEAEVAERTRIEEQLAHGILYDALTDMPNRVLFMDRLQHAIDFAKRHSSYNFSVLFLDLDYFKNINDSLGHSIGDQLLISLSQRLRMCVRSTDTVARLGGDEFVILIEEIHSYDDTVNTAERILQKLTTPFILLDHQLFASASIGVVLNAKEYHQPEEILRDADIAMYQAKALGKARYEIFNVGLRDKAVIRLELENDLHSALAGNQFLLHYQPVIALNTGSITGFEALLRWNHPTRGLISPSDFIPIAEETGLIIPIGKWVLEEACTQTRRWQAAYPNDPPLDVRVNISGKQIASPDFIPQIEQVLEDTGFDGRALKLEITENVCLNSADGLEIIFNRLNQMGIQFHIDDFGTGYSSLSYLQNYPIQSIKIDRSFISQMDCDGNGSNIVRTIIAMAHDLGMDAVAEGVETMDQLNQVKEFGCNYGQGYLISRPIDPSRVAALLASTSSVFTSPVIETPARH
jgi:diguanylate cyclase (GGDEF)-like protein